MTVPYGTRHIEITSLARDKLKRAELDEVYDTCRSRGLRLFLMFSARERTYVATLTAGGRTVEGRDAQPVEAFRKALAMYEGPRIASLLDAS